MYRLAFTYNRDLVTRAKGLPFATFDPASKSWTSRVCAQTVAQLRRWWHEGLLDVEFPGAFIQRIVRVIVLVVRLQHRLIDGQVPTRAVSGQGWCQSTVIKILSR